MYQCEDFAKANGYIKMWTGRIRHFNVPEADPHKAMSNLIQGGVAEIVRVAISRLFPAISDLGGYMLLQVHDSVTFEVPDEVLPVALPTIKMIMEDFDFVPAVGVDIEYGKSWGSFQKWDGKSPVAVLRDERTEVVSVPHPEDEADGSQRRASEGVYDDNSS